MGSQRLLWVYHGMPRDPHRVIPQNPAGLPMGSRGIPRDPAVSRGMPDEIPRVPTWHTAGSRELSWVLACVRG